MMATAALQTAREEPMSVPGKSPLVQGRGLDEGTGMRRRLAAILAAEGQKLSRRTVAKYRDQMRIPGSRERRQVI